MYDVKMLISHLHIQTTLPKINKIHKVDSLPQNNILSSALGIHFKATVILIVVFSRKSTGLGIMRPALQFHH